MNFSPFLVKKKNMTRLAVWPQCDHLGCKQLLDSVCCIKKGRFHLSGVLSLGEEASRNPWEALAYSPPNPSCHTYRSRKPKGTLRVLVQTLPYSHVTLRKLLNFLELPLLQNGFWFPGITTPLWFHTTSCLQESDSLQAVPQCPWMRDDTACFLTPQPEGTACFPFPNTTGLICILHLSRQEKLYSWRLKIILEKKTPLNIQLPLLKICPF